ncbi:MAG: hypothetical protein GC137_07295 [Alphaproteobacteria bacterium]|nr:hypothetical protein [Alphaproteobacteria bacterium]
MALIKAWGIAQNRQLTEGPSIVGHVFNHKSLRNGDVIPLRNIKGVKDGNIVVCHADPKYFVGEGDEFELKDINPQFLSVAPDFDKDKFLERYDVL